MRPPAGIFSSFAPPRRFLMLAMQSEQNDVSRPAIEERSDRLLFEIQYKNTVR